MEPWSGLTAKDGIEVIDWGSALIMPGLVNTHSHLELTKLHGLLQGTGSLPGWIQRLTDTCRNWKRRDYLESSRMGARLAIQAGTTLVGDISAGGYSREALIAEKFRKVVFEEVLSFLPERAPEKLKELERRVECYGNNNLLTAGVSPHAPYSVSPHLYCAVSRLASDRDLPMTTHLAESEEEVEFLSSGTGEFRSLLNGFGILPADWEPPGCTPTRYLETLGVLEKPMVLAHCNYLDDDSIRVIQESRSSVAFCPRSHHFFGHQTHPVRALLDRGVNVALGTDSLGSNDSLSMLDEMRFLRARRSDLTHSEIIRMATLNGATALGFAGLLGRLRRGYWADMTVLDLPESTGSKHLMREVLEGAGVCRGTIVHGEVIWRKD